MRPARIAALIVGCLLAPLASALFLGGGALGLGYLSQREADGDITTDTRLLDSSTAAVTAEDVTVIFDGDTPRWLLRLLDSDLRVTIAARSAHRPPRDLYHAALTVSLDGVTTSIEMGPVWNVADPDRGVVGTGPVGSPLLGRIRMFQYEIRCWRGGRIPDLDYAVQSHELSSDRARAAQVLDLTREVPLATWGRDEQRAGEMWNSNSMVSWVLARSGHDLAQVQPPARGRAPGWDAGLVVAARVSPAGPATASHIVRSTRRENHEGQRSTEHGEGRHHRQAGIRRSL